jgi:hypothetical protein
MSDQETLYILSRLAGMRYVVQYLLARQALSQDDPEAWLAAEQARLAGAFQAAHAPAGVAKPVDVMVGEMREAVNEIIAGAGQIVETTPRPATRKS